ncbi:MAG TPA: hypothetical protein VHW46_06630 [Terracidiphilus sp.]|jgi:hypothetical protein|nr:hypothetical protein [Terracidiphilus sp.]
MLHLVLAELADAQVIHEPIAMWAFLAIGAIALFGIFLPVSVWVDARQKEREAYYKAETIRRVAEASGEGAKAAIDLLRENDRISQIRKLEGMKLGGLITLAVGIGSSCMLGVMTHGGLLSTVGLIPGLIGVALLVYVFFLAEPV